MPRTLPIQIGNTVCFTAEVIRRCGHDRTTATRRGYVQELTSGGQLARVAWDDDSKIQLVPVANLAVINAQGVIIDSTY